MLHLYTDKSKNLYLYLRPVFLIKNYISHMKTETFTAHFLNLKWGLAKETEL